MGGVDEGDLRWRELRRVILAKSDMGQVATAARYLWDHRSGLNEDVVRVLWTGIVVTYARPFSKSNKVGPVGGCIVRLDDRMQKSLHERLSDDLRNVLFAHTDETALRSIVDTHALVGIGTRGFAEQYTPMNLGALRDIAGLADMFSERFAARIDELQAQLGQHRDPDV